VQALQADDPRRIDDFALLHRLGQGAMGSVYLGRSRGGRPVAVKVARAELVAEPEFRERFRREVGMARQVGGFWTAAVVDADPDAERPWLATEYIPGPSLQQAVAERGALPAPSALRLAAGLADAVAAIHKTGLVHRDLKPSNVLLDRDGPRVIDFGIALAVRNTTLTAPGEFFGTPGFLSPEQISGAPVGPASDVFALGAVLVFATTGTGPFGEGDTPVLLHRAAHGEADLSGVPEAVRDIVTMCLRHDPDTRPTPQQLLEHLADQPAPTSNLWLPQPVQTLVEQHHTELRTVLDAPGETRREQEGAPDDAARFRTSRVPAALWAVANAIGAIMVSGLGNPLFPPEVRLTGAVATTVFCMIAALLLFKAVRPQRTLEVTAEGLAVSHGRQRWRLPWRAVARTRVVVGHHTGLVAWLTSETTKPQGRAFPPHHGGIRVHSVRGSRRHRHNEVSELRAALAWYGPETYDPAP
jgi:eukaryotic-like serine/threonine-protein kinase